MSKAIQACDKYLCRTFLLGKNKIINKIKFIWDLYRNGKISDRNIPLLVTRWKVVEPLLNHSYKFKIHPIFTFPFKSKFTHSEFDLRSGIIAKDSNDPDKIFFQLLKDTEKGPNEIFIFTDGSRTVSDDPVECENRVGCAVLIPYIEKSFLYKLNPMTNSFSAEVFAIDKALQLVDLYGWDKVNIVTDSLSVFTGFEIC